MRRLQMARLQELLNSCETKKEALLLGIKLGYNRGWYARWRNRQKQVA